MVHDFHSSPSPSPGLNYETKMEAMRNNLYVIDENSKELSSIYSPNLSPAKALAKNPKMLFPPVKVPSFNLSPSNMSERDYNSNMKNILRLGSTKQSILGQPIVIEGDSQVPSSSNIMIDDVSDKDDDNDDDYSDDEFDR